MNSKDFLNSLPPIYWSNKHPSTYVFLNNMRPAGIGLLAPAEPGAWNLIHDKFDWGTLAGHQQAVTWWSFLKSALKVQVQGYPLDETVVFLGPHTGPEWWAANRNAAPLTARLHIDNVMALGPVDHV